MNYIDLVDSFDVTLSKAIVGTDGIKAAILRIAEEIHAKIIKEYPELNDVGHSGYFALCDAENQKAEDLLTKWLTV